MFEMRLDPPTHPADEFDPGAVVAADYATEVINLCDLLGETDARFHVSGFGLPSWPVDVAYDLSAVMEQLPGVIRALVAGADTELDFFSQGIERTLEFHPSGGVCRIVCESRTGWTPDPAEIEMKTNDLVVMLQELARGFGQAVAIAAPSLVNLSPFNAWRSGEYEW
jgi:hypothetical protein